MERLSGVFVRLRSRPLGTYLHADENGVSVSMSADGAALNTVWRVESVHLRHLRGEYVSFQGAAYGRYLAVSTHGNDLWGGASDEVHIRHCRYNSRYIGVTGQNPDERRCRWIIERLPCRLEAPALPNPPVMDPFRYPVLTRTILFARSGGEDGRIPPSSWRRFVFRGCSVLKLRAEIAGRLGEANSDICLYIWTGTGHNISSIPLVTNLPVNSDPIVLCVLKMDSQDAAALRYPQL